MHQGPIVFGAASALFQIDGYRTPRLEAKEDAPVRLWAGVAAVVLVAAVAVSRLKPAAPTVDRSTIWTDTVKRGPMIRQVRGSTGTLVPREDSIELIPGADRCDRGADPRFARSQGHSGYDPDGPGRSAA